MVSAYLFSAIVGVSLLVGSLLLGDHHDGDASTSGGHESAGEGMGAVLLSLRTWTYLLAFGGLTGLLLHWAADTSEPVTALIAGGVGLTSGLAAQWAFAKVSGTGHVGMIQPSELVGRTGTLLLPCAVGQTSQVRVTVRGSTLDLLARTSHSTTLAAGREVLIVALDGGEALVVPAEDDVITASPAVPTQAVPTQAVPAQAVPADAVPSSAVPSSAVLTDLVADRGDKELT